MKATIETARFQLLITGSSLLLVAASITIPWYIARQDLLKLIKANTQTFAAERVQILSREIDIRRGALHTLRALLENNPPQKSEDILTSLNGFLASDKAFSSAFIITEPAVWPEILKEQRTSTDCADKCLNNIDMYAHDRIARLVTRSSKARSDSKTYMKLSDYDDKNWFKLSLETKSFTLSLPKLEDSAKGDSEIKLARLVMPFSASEELLGILGADVNLSVLFEPLDIHNQARRESLMVFSAEGTLLAHSDPEIAKSHVLSGFEEQQKQSFLRGVTMQQEGFIAVPVKVPAANWTLVAIAQEDVLLAPLNTVLRKSIPVGFMGVVIFGLIAYFFQRHYLRLQGTAKAIAILHETVNRLATATQHSQIYTFIETELTQRFGLRYVTIAAVSDNSCKVLRGPDLAVSAERAAAQMCSLNTGTMLNLNEAGYRVLILQPTQQPTIKPAIVAIFPWPQQFAANQLDEFSAFMVANLVEQALGSLERLDALVAKGAEPLLRRIQETMLTKGEGRSQTHVAQAFLQRGKSVGGFWHGELRSKSHVFIMFGQIHEPDAIAVHQSLALKAGLASIKSLFSDDIVDFMSSSDLVQHVQKVGASESVVSDLICVRIPQNLEAPLDYSFCGSPQGFLWHAGRVEAVTRFRNAKVGDVVSLEAGYGTVLLLMSSHAEIGSQQLETVLAESKKEGKKSKDLLMALASIAPPDTAQDMGMLLIEFR